MNHYALLAFGVICAGAGGELFVRGAVGLARWLRVSPGIIGATVAAFATSSPELSVAVSAASAGEPAISLGDALGSNVVNIALILAIALLISGIQGSRAAVRRDLPVALLVPVATAFLAWDGMISRLDAGLLLGFFAAWMGATVAEARKERSAAGETIGVRNGALAAGYCVAGLAFLIAAGNLIVGGAKGLAVSFGIDEFVIGATVVAIGTSVPELATTVISKMRGHDEVGLGTVLGSNIFNGLFIVPVAGAICPIVVQPREASLALGFGLVAVALVYPPRSGFIGRRRGAVLLAIYAAYLWAVLSFTGADAAH